MDSQNFLPAALGVGLRRTLSANRAIAIESLFPALIDPQVEPVGGSPRRPRVIIKARAKQTSPPSSVAVLSDGSQGGELREISEVNIFSFSTTYWKIVDRPLQRKMLEKGQ